MQTRFESPAVVGGLPRQPIGPLHQFTVAQLLRSLVTVASALALIPALGAPTASLLGLMAVALTFRFGMAATTFFGASFYAASLTSPDALAMSRMTLCAAAAVGLIWWELLLRYLEQRGFSRLFRSPGS